MIDFDADAILLIMLRFIDDVITPRDGARLCFFIEHAATPLLLRRAFATLGLMLFAYFTLPRHDRCYDVYVTRYAEATLLFSLYVTDAARTTLHWYARMIWRVVDE